MMKKYIFPLILLIILGIEVFFLDDITLNVSKLLNNHPDVVIGQKNEYSKNYNFLYVKDNKTFIPYSYGDLMDIFYSILNNGWDKFTFYCPEEYENCIKDIQSIGSNDNTLTSINNYVNPFNSFISINTTYDDSGEVTIDVEKLYNQDKIDFIKARVNEILSKNINNNMSVEDKIKVIHDYIINNTKYDVERNEKNTSQYESNTAYGLLKDGYAICSGYADTMAIFLHEMGIENYKVASATHVWNAVKLNDKWYHLDLTWDDPVSNTGDDILDHKYFLINSDKLKEADGKELQDHIFDKTIYLEFKNN